MLHSTHHSSFARSPTGAYACAKGPPVLETVALVFSCAFVWTLATLYFGLNPWIAERGVVDPRQYPLTAASLREICRDPEPGFVIADVEIARLAERTGGAAISGPLLLYTCTIAREMPHA